MFLLLYWQKKQSQCKNLQLFTIINQHVKMYYLLYDYHLCPTDTGGLQKVYGVCRRFADRTTTCPACKPRVPQAKSKSRSYDAIPVSKLRQSEVCVTIALNLRSDDCVPYALLRMRRTMIRMRISVARAAAMIQGMAPLPSSVIPEASGTILDWP